MLRSLSAVEGGRNGALPGKEPPLTAPQGCPGLSGPTLHRNLLTLTVSYWFTQDVYQHTHKTLYLNVKESKEGKDDRHGEQRVDARLTEALGKEGGAGEIERMKTS